MTSGFCRMPSSTIMRSVADGDFAAIDDSGDSPAGDGLKICGASKLEPSFRRGGDDGAGERMFAGSFEAGGEAQQFGLASERRSDMLATLRLAFGECAGFVDDQRVDFFQGLEGFGVFDQDSGAGAAAGADHDGHGRGESEGAGAGDDEDGDGVDQRVRQARLRAEAEPYDEGDDGDGNDRGNEPCGDAIGEALDGGAAALGLSDQLDDAREQGFGADALGSHDEGSGAVDGGADDFAAGVPFRPGWIRR